MNEEIKKHADGSGGKNDVNGFDEASAAKFEDSESADNSNAEGKSETSEAGYNENAESSLSEANTSDGNFVPRNVNKPNDSVYTANNLYEWLEVFAYALAVMMILFLFVFKYVSVDGSSMSPTFNANLIDNDTSNDSVEDRLIITNLFYYPKTGDVIVINSSRHPKPLIKRVIAVEGQTVKIRFSDWHVWVDGNLLDESEYLIEDQNYFPDGPMNNGSFLYDEVEFTVETGKVFVMGDNRNNSLDSRYDQIGQLDIDDIMGKVIMRVYPMGKMKWFW